MDSNRHRCEY